MNIVDWFEKNLFHKEEVKSDANYISGESISIKDAIKIEKNCDSTINANDNIIGNSFYGIVINNNYAEKCDIKDNELVKIKVDEINKILGKGNSEAALAEFNKLNMQVLGSGLSDRDKFSIYLGMLNCCVNLSNKDKEIHEYISKLEVLVNVPDYHRFKYLQAVFAFNNQKYEDARIFCESAIKLKKEYLRARILMVLIKTFCSEIGYQEAIEEINQIEKMDTSNNLPFEDYCIAKANVSLVRKKYSEVIGYFEKVYVKLPSISNEANLGIGYFLIATQKRNNEAFIKYYELDFDSLSKSIKIFESVYKKAMKSGHKEVLRRILPFYLNGLQLIEKPSDVLDIVLESKYVIDLTDKNILRIAAQSELYTGRTVVGALNKLEEHDKFSIEIEALLDQSKFHEIVDKLDGVIDRIPKEDCNIVYAYLSALLRIDGEKFVSKYRWFRTSYPEDSIFELIYIEYLEFNKRIQEAKKLIDNIVMVDPNPVTLRIAFDFYKRNKFMDECFQLTTKVVNGVIKVRENDYQEIVKSHFFALTNNQDYKNAEDFYKEIKKMSISVEVMLLIDIEFERIQGNLRSLAEKSYEYAELTKNYSFTIQSADSFMKIGDVKKAIKILEQLSIINKYERAELHILLSKAYLLDGNHEKAYIEANFAKEIDKGIPGSRSHAFYVLMSLRCDKVENGTSYMVSYNEEFPKNGWIKTGQIIKTDEKGNEVFDISEFERLIDDSGNYKKVKRLFLDYQIGLSTYLNLTGQNSLPLIINEMRQRKLYIKISDGIVERVNHDVNIVKSELIVDALTLFVLMESETEEILSYFDKIFVAYSTIEYLQEILFSYEIDLIRRILVFIKSASNIVVLPLKLASLEKNNFYLEETMQCLSLCKEKKIPYLCVDFNVKAGDEYPEVVIVNLPTVIKATFVNNESNMVRLSELTHRLMFHRYTFMNFNSLDIYWQYKKISEYACVEECLAAFLCMNRFSEYASFVNVYLDFLNKIESEINEDEYICVFLTIFKWLDKYIGKMRYYYFQLQEEDVKAFGDKFRLPDKFSTSTFFFYNTDLDTKSGNGKFKQIKGNLKFKRIEAVVSSITRGVYYFLLKYNIEEHKLMRYYNLLDEKFEFIDGFTMEMILKLIKNDKK